MSEDFKPIAKPKKPPKRKSNDKEAYHEATERARDPEGFLRCELCGRSLLDGQEIRHHVKFRSQGGETAPSNLLIICNFCHGEQHGIRHVTDKGKENEFF